MIAVTARISGRDMGSTIIEIKKILVKDDLLPLNMYYELGGLYQQQQIAFNGLIAIFIAALALIFVLLLFMYEDFYAAIAIIISPLLAMSAVFIGLWMSWPNSTGDFNEKQYQSIIKMSEWNRINHPFILLTAYNNAQPINYRNMIIID